MPANSAIVAYRKIIRGSERSFGVTFALVFAVVGFWPVVCRCGTPRWWASNQPSLPYYAFVAPSFPLPLNVLWFKFGLLLHEIVNPILMALIYYAAVVPMPSCLRWPEVNYKDAFELD